MDISYLILAKGTTDMLKLNSILQKEAINTDLVPSPPESGTVCAIAIKVMEQNLEFAKRIIDENNINISQIVKDRKLKLQGLIDRKLKQEVTLEYISIVEKIQRGDDISKDEIVYLLETDKPKEIEGIYNIADKIRQETVGDIVEIRGAIEFSNYCIKSCDYCGIGKTVNCIERYRMTEEEILEVVESLHNHGIKTVILQSGEDPLWTIEKLTNLLKIIKDRFKMRITLSVGEKTKEEYEILRDAGGDNFLLKIETTNRQLFQSIHPDDDFDTRVTCSKWLKELGYINGSGNIIGLPGQTIEDIAEDIIFFKEMGINMIGVGPFIPAKGSVLQNLPTGDIDLTLRALSLTRIVCKRVFLPATTALASLHKDAQIWALEKGANTIMLINTPPKYRNNYQLYNDKNMVDFESAIYAVEGAKRKMPSYIKL